MKRFKNSDLIMPFSIVIDLTIINWVLYYLTPHTYFNSLNMVYYNASWLVISYFLNYYPKSRKERFMTNFHKMIQAFAIFGLAYFALFGLMGRNFTSLYYQLLVFFLVCVCLLWYRLIFFWTLRKYRRFGGNSVSAVVIGKDANLKKIKQEFEDPDLGYRYKGFFDDQPSKRPNYLGKIVDCFGYILENNIDEIYCVASKFNHQQLKNLIYFADNNLIRFKIILDNKEIYSRAMLIESYGNVPVLNLRKVPLDTEFARIIKRSFDLIFSSLVILFVLSWLTPLLYVLIKLESPGNLFFKQKRHGFKRRAFYCYKFRSMTDNNKNANSKMATKNDMRLTRIGKILRKTSIDELPQFFNVFMGDMSVVGPRPHMELDTMTYETSVDKYLVRHFVKPGITGLAQVKGYRGEILKKTDILNRVRLDIFYVEKWTIGFDLSIIGQTVINAVRGDEKAY